VTSSLGRSLDPRRLLPGHEDRVYIKSMSGGRIEDATNVLVNTKYTNSTVSILIGTNNIGSGQSATECFDKYKDMVTKTLASQPDAQINLIELPQRMDNPKRNRAILQLNEMLRSLISTDPRLQYMSADIEEGDLEPDGLHLNPTGTFKLVIALRKAILPNYTPPRLRSQRKSRYYNDDAANYSQQSHRNDDAANYSQQSYRNGWPPLSGARPRSYNDNPPRSPQRSRTFNDDAATRNLNQQSYRNDCPPMRAPPRAHLPASLPGPNVPLQSLGVPSWFSNSAPSREPTGMARSNPPLATGPPPAHAPPPMCAPTWQSAPSPLAEPSLQMEKLVERFLFKYLGSHLNN
jgi:hypothetical protein